MKKYLLFVILMFICVSCQNSCLNEEKVLYPGLSRSVIQQDFDWETADYMPTPNGYEPIPSPWNGAGSLVGTYDLSVLNDRKKSDGWTLLYNSFTTDATKYASNPYFVIYNKYRGIMRVFYYVTTEFITTSSFVMDNLHIISRYPIRMFSFADNVLVNGSNTRVELTHIQPKASDGSLPVASHKWYMAQYEMAYDPSIVSIPYNQVMLDFNLNYRQISELKLNGTQIGELKGTIGEQSKGEFNKALKSEIKEGGKAVLSNVSYDLLKKAQIDESGLNTLGVNKRIFSSVIKSVSKLSSSSIGDFCGATLGVFSSIFGGTKTNSTPFTANINTSFEGKGNIENDGSFPSMPIAMYMPGTNIPVGATGMMPLYNKPLGVFNMKGTPIIYLTHSIIRRNRHDDPYNPGATITEVTEKLSCGQAQSYEQYLQFNPEVQKIADVSVVKEQLFALDDAGNYYSNREFSAYSSGEFGAPIENIPNVTFYVYFTIAVKPKDGSPSTYISKSFVLDNVTKTTETWLPDL